MGHALIGGVGTPEGSLQSISGTPPQMTRTDSSPSRFSNRVLYPVLYPISHCGAEAWWRLGLRYWFTPSETFHQLPALECV
jgi:hypothetical protein